MMYDFDASQIESWAGRQDARGNFPSLIRKLLKATLPGDNYYLKMPGGSSVDNSGWDGILRVDCGNRWAPDGVSGWEFSCGKDISRQANKNYKSRTSDPLEINRETSTFVFVTPRRWSGKDAWEGKHRKEGKWRDVRVYDADDLVSWLEESIEVSEWFAGILSGLPNIFDLTDMMRGMSAQLQSLTNGPERQVKHPDSESWQHPDHQEVLDTIDTANRFLHEGQIITAREKLKGIEHEAAQLPDELRFRFLTSLANCELHEDKDSDAVSLILEAHKIQPENPIGITNASLAARLQKDYSRALDYAEKALEINAGDSVAVANLISSLWELGRNDQLEDYVASEEWIASDLNSGVALAKIRIQQGRYKDAETIYRSLIETNPDDPNVYAGLSQCLVSYALKDRTSISYSESLKGILCEAESMASQAIELLYPTQLVARRNEVLLLRAYARSRLEKVDESMHDVDSVLSNSPENPSAIQHKGILLLKKGDAEEACRWLEKIQDPDTREDSLLPLADAYLRSGDAKSAITLLRDSFQLDPPEWEDLARAQSLLRAEDKAGVDDSVGPMIEAAISQYPRDPTLFVLSAVRNSLKGNIEATASSLMEAISLSSGPFARMLRSQLGHLYEREGRNLEAAEQFSEVCGDDITHPDAISMLLSLFYSEQYRHALEIATRFREELELPPKYALDVEAEIRGYVGDVKTAALLLREICSRTDSIPDDRVKLAEFQYRCGEFTHASETIRKIDVSELKHSPQFLMSLAKMKRALGIPDFISDAYLSQRYGLNDPNIQMEYFSLFMDLIEEWEEPSVIEPGCLVRTRIDGEDIWWQIIEHTESPLSDRELSPDNEFAQRLLGRKVGDVFDLRQGFEVGKCEIMELQSKYVHVFQEIHEKFQMRFPNDPSLSRFKVDSDFTSIFRIVDERGFRVQSVEEMYESQQIPFVSSCNWVGSSILMAWVEYTRTTGRRFWFGQDSNQEISEGSKLLRDSTAVTLDMIALLTIHKLKLSDSLRSRFSSVSIPQFAFDEIQGEANRTKTSKAHKGYIGKDRKGRYFINEISEDFREEWKEYVSSLYDLAKTFERIPAYSILATDEPQTILEVFSRPGAGTVYLGDESREVNSVLISDDFVLSKFARTQDIEVVNSQMVLEELLRSRVITEERYSSDIEELSLMNYWFVRVSAKDVLQSLESSNYHTTLGIRAMLRTLQGPTCLEDAAVAVASDIIGAVARKTMLPDQFELLLTIVLTEMRSGRHSNSVLRKFWREISSRLRYNPVRLYQTQDIVRSVMQSI